MLYYLHIYLHRACIVDKLIKVPLLRGVAAVQSIYGFNRHDGKDLPLRKVMDVEEKKGSARNPGPVFAIVSILSSVRQRQHQRQPPENWNRADSGRLLLWDAPRGITCRAIQALESSKMEGLCYASHNRQQHTDTISRCPIYRCVVGFTGTVLSFQIMCLSLESSASEACNARTVTDEPFAPDRSGSRFQFRRKGC